jgi:hypothetical protein
VVLIARSSHIHIGAIAVDAALIFLSFSPVGAFVLLSLVMQPACRFLFYL